MAELSANVRMIRAVGLNYEKLQEWKEHGSCVKKMPFIYKVYLPKRQNGSYPSCPVKQAIKWV